MREAAASRVAGNEYIDFDMAFGVLAAGHSHPLLAERCSTESPTARVTVPVADASSWRRIKRDSAPIRALQQLGTEATMDAIRARGYTGREKIIKMGVATTGTTTTCS